MNNNNQQQQNTNQNNVSANNLNETDPNISNISDFFITNDPSQHVVSSRQFEQQIGNEDQINRDFNWLDYQTGQSHYDPVAWRSSPVPMNTNANLIHEYSGNVSYNDILTESESNSTGSMNNIFNINEANINLNVSAELNEFQVTHDPLDHAESTSQFDLRIGDEIEINDDFNWLSNHTNNRNAEWRSSPLPPVRINFERARSVPNVHEYSGNVSYNDARSQSDSDIYSYQRSQSFQDCGMFVNTPIYMKGRLLNTSDEIIKQDFFYIPDPSDQFESSRQFKKTIGNSDQKLEMAFYSLYKDCDDYVESTADFEERIADEEEIASEFQWLSDFTVETSYLPRHWRSTPIIFEEVNPPDNFEEIVNDSRIVDVVNIDNFQDYRDLLDIKAPGENHIKPPLNLPPPPAECR
ncbi:hypothetical protein DERP_013261 [Dermatophagoides pteronyssinus]|uniref:Uncharacterized protein n=1 Tax=Dermatophagoides pteronyssinus TaxID=6956 RepID=A0ABQ8IRJ8_DERPT|nr:hypothetical protein DERP_013261 [Dermatophagoides pteronyssinus]